MILGFSTGCFYKWCKPISKEAITLVRSLGVQAIELHAGYPDRVDLLNTITKSDLTEFSYVSLHAPTCIRYGDNQATRDVLAIIEQWCKQVQPDAVIFHPDTIDDWRICSFFDIPYAFENMDAQKSFGTSPQEIRSVLAKDDAFHALLDVQHIYTHDTEMKQTEEYLAIMGHRLIEVHLSAQADEQCSHGPLYRLNQDIILTKTPKHVPIIIESVLSSKEEAEQELAYVQKFLN